MKSKKISLLFMVLVIFTFVNPQGNNQSNDTTQKSSGNVPISNIETKMKDSLLRVANSNLDVAITLTTKIPQKKRELLEVKLREQKAMREYISAVDKYLKASGRTEKIIVMSSLKQQLQSGEIFLVKDSTCVETKKKFLRKKKCVQWKYTFYLQDKKGNKEQLF